MGVVRVTRRGGITTINATGVDEAIDRVVASHEPACGATFKRPASPASDHDQPSRDEIARGFRSIAGEVERCAKVNEYAGTLQVRAKFTPSGTVAVATVNDAPEAVASCVARKIKLPRRGTAWPYRFRTSCNKRSMSACFAADICAR